MEIYYVYCLVYIRHRALARLVCLRRWGVGGSFWEVVSLSKGRPPGLATSCGFPHLRLAYSFCNAAFGAQIAGKWGSRGRPDMQSAHACACFGEVALFPRKMRKCREIDQKGSHVRIPFWPRNRSITLKIGARGIRGAKKDRLGVGYDIPA